MTVVRRAGNSSGPRKEAVKIHEDVNHIVGGTKTVTAERMDGWICAAQNTLPVRGYREVKSKGHRAAPADPNVAVTVTALVIGATRVAIQYTPENPPELWREV